MNTKFLFDVPLGINKADTRKQVWPAIIGALGGIAAAGLSSYSNNASGHNDRVLARWQQNQNEALTREQMAAQRKQFEDEIAENRYLTQQARDWQLQDIASERAYNDPAAIKMRLQQAGINPYLAMTSGAAGQMAGSGVGSPSMSTHGMPSPSASIGAANVGVTPSYRPVYDIGRGISDAAEKLMGLFQVDADISRSRTLNALDTAKTMAVVSEMKANKEYKRALTEDIWRQYKEANETRSERLRSYELQNKQIQSNIDYQTAMANTADAHSLELLTRAGLNRAQADDIVKTAQYRIRLLSAQSMFYTSEADRNRMLNKLDNWWLTPNGYIKGYNGISGRPIDLQFSNQYEESVAKTILELKEAAHYGEMTREEKESFDSVLEHWVRPMVVGASYGMPYSITKQQDRGLVTEEQVIEGKNARGQKVKSTYTRKRPPLKVR